MRIIFMGSPEFAVPSLAALHAAGHELVAVYCQPPRAAGRGKALRPTPVQQLAEQLAIPVRHPASLRDAGEQQAFAELGADAALVAAYGLILPRPILAAPRLGCVNVHASLLPRWRGAAPVQRAILAGDAVTGVTLMQMEAGLDTGPMLARSEVAIERQTAGELTAELADIGAQMAAEWCANPNAYRPVPQPAEGVTYAAKIDKAEARIAWGRSAADVERQVRAFAPAPGAWFLAGDERIRLLSAEAVLGDGSPGEVIDDHLTIACAAGAIRPLLVQRSGRAPISAEQLLRGFAIPRGTLLQ